MTLNEEKLNPEIQMAATPHSDATVDPKARPGASWKDEEEHVIPKNRLGVVFFGLMCALFLSAMDQTIVATSLPTIAESLGGGNSYSWVGSAYMLAGGAFGPLYGKLSNMFGRKPVLYSSMLTFLLGSAMCGAAQNMTWLIVCRAIQGIGSGGTIQLVAIIISDIVPLKDRGRYSGFNGAMYGAASATGPILGGALAQHVSWRWCFFINLPVGGLAVAILIVFLNLNPHQKRPIRDELANFDFIGLVSLVAGVVCLLIGFDFSQSSWADIKTIVPLVFGVILLTAGGINEVFTKRSAIVPARLFKTRTTAIILIAVFVHALVYFAVSYYLPLFYQVLGASATGSGIKMLPFALAISLASIVSGLVVSQTGRYRPTIWVATIMMTFGMALMIKLNYNSSPVIQEILPAIAAIGMGCLYQVPMVALQAAMPLKDMATASSGLLFIRTVGGAVGIAVGETIITSILPGKLLRISDFASLGLGTTAAELNDNYYKVHLIPNVTLRHAVLHSWSDTISTIWIMSAPMCGLVLILTLFLREYSLDRKVVRIGEPNMTGDIEKGVAESRNEEDEKLEVQHDISNRNTITITPAEKSIVGKEKVEVEIYHTQNA